MSTTQKIDMKFEVVVIPVSDVDRAKKFYAHLGWRLDADFDDGNELPRAPVHAARLRVLGHLRQERHRGGTRLRPGPVPDRLRHRGRPRRAARSRRRGQRGVPQRRRVHRSRTSPICSGASGSAVRIPSTAATARSPRSVIRTATAGCSRRSRRGWPVASIPRRRPSRRRTIWRARFGAPSTPTASTRPGPAAEGRELARLVRRVHGGGAVGQGAAVVTALRRDRHRHRPGRPSLTLRLAGAGMKVAVVERKLFGGTCVNTGCIPTKTMVASAYAAHIAASRRRVRRRRRARSAST